MKLLDFVIVKLTIYLVTGILLSRFIDISLLISTEIFGVLLILLTLIYFISKPQLKKTIWFGLISYITMISLGILLVTLHNQKNHKGHYSYSSVFIQDSILSVTLKVSNRLKPNNFNDRYVVSILKINEVSVKGLSLLNIRKDSLTRAFDVDDILIIKTQIHAVKAPLNPDQFNFKKFLENKYIYSQIYSKYEDVFIAETKTSSIYGYADAIRKHINSKLQNHNFKPDELAIINALLLGQRQGLSENIYNDYKNAGSIHILAVSGLHVGIILLFLNFIFKPIEFIKYGHVYKIIAIIICLWGFAIIAGLSASVLRAALMFSFVAVAMNINRPRNTLNILAGSAFVLLLFNPNLLFDVGFQLSYLAVIAIVTIYPLLYSIWRPKYPVADKFWQAFIVSIAAQFGVLPISIYYFHQIPGLFLLSNVIAIPFLGFILGFGIIIIILSTINFLPSFLSTSYGKIIESMNLFFKWIAKQEAFLIQDISFNIFQVIASYILIITLYHLYTKKSYKQVLYVLVAILIGQSVLITTKYFTETKEQFVVFHKGTSSIIGFHKGRALQLHHSLIDSVEAKNTMITNYTTKNHITEIQEESLQTMYKINNKWLLVVDSLGIYNIKSFKPEYVWLRNSPKLNLNRLIDSIQPQVIIADGSNYKSYITRWEETCKAQKIPFHHTYKKGAFVIKLK
ncbi:ComEC/Rec2 family competence protein [Xanthomarina sp. F2636L]|uniref:ComEC/Rec2 family competence protein n=1 Tax=Xanthomarina sp. F2636L TaxID=2996018 RepID=UPI00225DED94|nr:ComEC/Rec2 family competence protein [Xanthomarina sp. F2636L]MCX7550864.1 ComEC/Rec2 family competence protein [Xanthomarina sp. F2636L]